MIPEYAVASVAAAVLVVVVDLRVWHTGLFRSRPYWIAIGICLFFMVLVNGWLTKLSAPIVLYDPDQKSPFRFPWDIPVEDYFFGFALLHWVLARWVRLSTPGQPGALTDRGCPGVDEGSGVDSAST